MHPDKIVIQYAPKITDDQLWDFYVRNDICEAGSGKEIAGKPLRSNCRIVGAFYNDLLVGIVRAFFDRVSAHIAEFCLERELQGEGLLYENGSLIEKDTYGIARRMGLLLVNELRDLGNTSISATILENCEESLYSSIGFTHNKHHLDFKIDERPYTRNG